MILTNLQFTATQCRASSNFCDLPEACDGKSEYCPDDIFRQNAEPCKTDDGSEAFCFNGSCRTHTSQCKLLWGPSGQTSDQCYSKNVNGSRHGNCGYDKHKTDYIACAPEDDKCGMLQCRHLNERLEYGMESVAILSHSFINYNRSIIPCRTAIIDLGLDAVDPGLTPSGAKCGDNKLCFDQKCLNVDEYKVDHSIFECPENCHNRGICNSNNKCHCDLGYDPFSHCKSYGCGGSEDGGPLDPSCKELYAINTFKLLLLYFRCRWKTYIYQDHHRSLFGCVILSTVWTFHILLAQKQL